MIKKTAAVLYDKSKGSLSCQGDWSLENYPQLEKTFQEMDWSAKQQVTIETAGINKLDSAGALLLIKIKQAITAKGAKVKINDLNNAHQTLVDMIAKRYEDEVEIPQVKPDALLVRIGKATIAQSKATMTFLSFVGLLGVEALYLLRHPQRIRWGALINVIYRNGYQALPIIALLSLMIGVVITYQMGLQLKSYGANIYIVDLLGIAVLREFAPLLTAIMVAGRTGSAFTAQLGTMKINQEVDALDTIGVTPAELLLLPRIIGLFIALPLLTVWADIFGVLGGVFMSNNMLGLTWYDFFLRFPHVIKLKTLLIGIGKAPVFALIIASVGCYQGMQVGSSADSVGLKTTRSVVLSIFFILVADALFSIIFSKLKL